MVSDDIERRMPWMDIRGSDSLGTPTVVIVDDQPANVAILQRLLVDVGGGIEVLGFTSSRAALEHCRRSLPSLILLDIHMPELDGFGFMELLSAIVPTDGLVPVLVLTADVTIETRERALAAGARDFLTKPFERTEVLLRVANLLDIRRLHDRLARSNADLRDELDVRIDAETQTHAELAERHRRIDQALEPGGLSMVFQPITDVRTGDIVGVEALARFSPRPWRAPDVWFAEADSIGRGRELELAAVAAALEQVDHVPPNAFLAVNVSPATATCPELDAALAGTPLSRVVLELTEHAKVDDYDLLLSALDRFRAQGVRVAVDDTGAGYAGFQSLLRLKPDILKLDTTLTRGIDADPVRRALAAALVTFAAEIDAEIIAEGIETRGELVALQHAGIRWGQGYFLARPGPLPVSGSPVAGAERS